MYHFLFKILSFTASLLYLSLGALITTIVDYPIVSLCATCIGTTAFMGTILHRAAFEYGKLSTIQNQEGFEYHIRALNPISMIVFLIGVRKDSFT